MVTYQVDPDDGDRADLWNAGFYLKIDTDDRLRRF
jgi:hypothetical protein